jgi:hypothetical protein
MGCIDVERWSYAWITGVPTLNDMGWMYTSSNWAHTNALEMVVDIFRWESRVDGIALSCAYNKVVAMQCWIEGEMKRVFVSSCVIPTFEHFVALDVLPKTSLLKLENLPRPRTVARSY